QQSGAGADRALHQRRQIPEAGLYAAQAARREGGGAAPGEARREAHRADRGAVVLPRRREAGPVQARSLSLLRRAEQPLELVQQAELALRDLAARGRQVEPGRAIDFGELPPLA